MFYVLFFLSLILFVSSFCLVHQFNIWFYDSEIDDKIYQILMYFNLAVAVVSLLSAVCCLYVLI